MRDVQGVPMVQRVWTHCMATGLRTAIATDDEELADYMKGFGAWVEMTGECATGTDRVAEFVTRSKLRADIICNVQCDMPFVPPEYPLKAVEVLLRHPEAEWSTLCAPHSVVAAIPAENKVTFARVGYNAHVGIYAFRRRALIAFAELPRSQREIAEELEQLRLVENGILGAIAFVPYLPLEVNTPADLEIVNRAA